MNPLSEVRAARAGLAFLFEPDSPPLHELVAAHGPVGAYQRLHGGSLPRAALRAELRHTPTADLWARVARVVAESGKPGTVLIPEDPDWPARLNDLGAMSLDGDTPVNAALCLWIQGPTPLGLALRQSVTVVGADKPTVYGTCFASDLCYALAERGWTVVSGWNQGLDRIALRGALAAGGTVVAGLPQGLEAVEPVGTGGLSVTRNGIAISLWPSDTPPTRHRVAVSYRLLAALSAGTVVVEAAPHGIELQALAAAARLARPAMVVPGQATSTLSAGCHEALRQDLRVRLVTGVDDVLAEIEAYDRSTIPARSVS